MDWLEAVQRLRAARTPSVIVTMAMVRGHAPRNGGAKMVVSADALFGTVGGGNLEATAIDRAREMIATGAAEPELLTLTLSDKVTAEYGVQCCGGEVTMLLEPVRVDPVGRDLRRRARRASSSRASSAARSSNSHLVDSRAEMLAPERIGVPGVSGVLADAVATVRRASRCPCPRPGSPSCPPGAHVLIMTHDHVEDLAICETALRTEGLGSIGLIGSRSKWARFQKQLRELGHDEAGLARVSTPIGIPGHPLEGSGGDRGERGRASAAARRGGRCRAGGCCGSAMPLRCLAPADRPGVRDRSAAGTRSAAARRGRAEHAAPRSRPSVDTDGAARRPEG